MGDIGPTGRMLPPVGTANVEELEDTFFQQAKALLQGGADLILYLVVKGEIKGKDLTKWGKDAQLDFSAELAKAKASGAEIEPLRGEGRDAARGHFG